jgi:TonB family protein
MNKYLITAMLALVAPAVQAQSIEQAAFLTRNEQYEDAAKVLNAMKAKKPSAVIHYSEGWNFLKADEITEALAAFDAAFKLGPKTPEGLIGMGIKLLWEGKATEADDYFSRGLLVAKKKRIPMLNNIGEAWLTAPKRNLDKALGYLRMATDGGISNPEGYILLGDVLWAINSKDLGQPIKHYMLAEEMEGCDVVVTLTRQGKVWAKGRVFDRAIDYFNRVIALDASYSPVYREFADLYYAQGNIHEGSRYYQEYLKRNSTPGARRKYIRALYLSKQYNEAITEGEVLIKEKPFGNVYGLMAYCLAEKPGSNAADASKGLMYLDLYVALSPGYEPTAFDLYTKSSLLAITGDTLAAWKVREEALFKEDANDIWYNDLAQLYYNQKAYVDAARIYSIKRQFSENFNIKDLMMLGTAYFYSNDFSTADNIMAEILESHPEYELGWLIRAKCNLAMDTLNHYWAARPYFKKWMSNLNEYDIEINKNDLILANLYLANSFIDQMNLSMAKYHYKNVLLLDSNNNEARYFLVKSEGIGEYIQYANDESELPLELVQVQAMPKGGINKFYQFVQEKFQYPERCQKKGINGYVLLKFVVDVDGSISDVKPVETTMDCPEFTKEAIRVLLASPYWTPARNGGKPVKAYRKIPIKLEIGEED